MIGGRTMSPRARKPELILDMAPSYFPQLPHFASATQSDWKRAGATGKIGEICRLDGIVWNIGLSDKNFLKLSQRDAEPPCRHSPISS